MSTNAKVYVSTLSLDSGDWQETGTGTIKMKHSTCRRFLSCLARAFCCRRRRRTTRAPKITELSPLPAPHPPSSSLIEEICTLPPAPLPSFAIAIPAFPVTPFPAIEEDFPLPSARTPHFTVPEEASPVPLPAPHTPPSPVKEAASPIPAASVVPIPSGEDDSPLPAPRTPSSPVTEEASPVDAALPSHTPAIEEDFPLPAPALEDDAAEGKKKKRRRHRRKVTAAVSSGVAPSSLPPPSPVTEAAIRLPAPAPIAVPVVEDTAALSTEVPAHSDNVVVTDGQKKKRTRQRRGARAAVNTAPTHDPTPPSTSGPIQFEEPEVADDIRDLVLMRRGQELTYSRVVYVEGVDATHADGDGWAECCVRKEEAMRRRRVKQQAPAAAAPATPRTKEVAAAAAARKPRKKRQQAAARGPVWASWQEPEVECLLPVSPHLRRHIVGRGAAHLSDLRREFPAVRVRVPPPNDFVSGDVAVTGPRSQAHAALARLTALLQHPRPATKPKLPTTHDPQAPIQNSPHPSNSITRTASPTSSSSVKKPKKINTQQKKNKMNKKAFIKKGGQKVPKGRRN